MGCASSSQVAKSKADSVDPQSTDEERHIHFSAVIKHRSTREMLTNFARSEHSEENLLFYSDVRDFKKQFTTYGHVVPDESLMRQEAERIIDRYLRADAPDALNLPSAHLAQFKHGLTTDTPCTANMFDAVARVIYKAVEVDTFKRFSRTDMAEEMAAAFPGVLDESRQTSAVTNESEADQATADTPAIVA